MERKELRAMPVNEAAAVLRAAADQLEAEAIEPYASAVAGRPPRARRLGAMLIVLMHEDGVQLLAGAVPGVEAEGMVLFGQSVGAGLAAACEAALPDPSVPAAEMMRFVGGGQS